MESLNIINLSKTFGSQSVLKDVSLSVNPGEFLILIGPSGCGKSTLLNIIAGLETATDGDIFIGDRNVTHLPSKDRDIAMVFQSYALYPTMTVRQNIAFGMEVRKTPKADIVATINRVAKLLQLEELLDRKPSQLSGGQRQRVAMGRALSRNPRLFLFDEPLSNLDAKLRVDMRTEIKKLHHSMGTTIAYVTHDQIEAMTLGDRIAVMNDGVIQQFGTPQEVYNEPVNRFVAGFLGSPTMNFIPVLVSEDGLSFSLASRIEEKTFPITGQSPGAIQPYRGQEVIAGIRPEHFYHKSEAGTQSIVIDNELHELTGADLLIHTNLNGAPAICRCNPDIMVDRNGQVEIGIKTNNIIFFDPATGESIR